jgi:hypothetical protein
MAHPLNRPVEISPIASDIEIREADLEIRFDSIWKSNFWTHKKIEIWRIHAKVDLEADYPFHLQIAYSPQQIRSYCVYDMDTNLILTTQKIADIGQLKAIGSKMGLMEI